MNQLRVPELKAVCRSIGLPVSGRKSDLQQRIKEYLENSFQPGHIDPFRPKAILVLVQKSKIGEPLPTYESILQALKTGAFNHPVATGHLPPSSLYSSNTKDVIQNNKNGSNVCRTGISVGQNSPLTSVFYQSPFYNLKRMISGSPKLAGKSAGRETCLMRFRLNETEKGLLNSSPDTRIFLLCGPISQGNRVHIEFPQPNEIKLNDTLIKDNVRGLKNKVGTAKPADLTKFVNIDSENYLQLVYAFTKEDYLVYLYIVTLNNPEKILQEILDRPKIVKQYTLAYINKMLDGDEDEDLMMTSTVISLQCPISYSRMKYPSKSINCDHLQCFDAMSFILSQIQIPTWQCPVCQKSIEIGHLAICEFVASIVATADHCMEQVQINSDGTWLPKEEEAPQDHKGQSSGIENKPTLKNEDVDKVILDDDASAIDCNTLPEPIIISLDSDGDEDSPLSKIANNIGRNNASTSTNFEKNTQQIPPPILTNSFTNARLSPVKKTTLNSNKSIQVSQQLTAPNSGTVHSSSLAPLPGSESSLIGRSRDSTRTGDFASNNLHYSLHDNTNDLVTRDSMSSINCQRNNLTPQTSVAGTTSSNFTVPVDAIKNSIINNGNVNEDQPIINGYKETEKPTAKNLNLNLSDEQSLLFSGQASGYSKVSNNNNSNHNYLPILNTDKNNSALNLDRTNTDSTPHRFIGNSNSLNLSTESVEEFPVRQLPKQAQLTNVSSLSDYKVNLDGSKNTDTQRAHPVSEDLQVSSNKSSPVSKHNSRFLSIFGEQSVNTANSPATDLPNNSKQKKPPVSPFIPRVYSSIVPKKRIFLNPEQAKNPANSRMFNNHQETGENTQK